MLLRVRYLLRAFYLFVGASLPLLVVEPEEDLARLRTTVITALLLLLALRELVAMLVPPEARHGMTRLATARFEPILDLVATIVRGGVGVSLFMGAAYVASLSSPTYSDESRRLMGVAIATGGSLGLLYLGWVLGFSEASNTLWRARRLLVRRGTFFTTWLDLRSATGVSVHLTEYQRESGAVAGRRYRTVIVLGTRTVPYDPQGFFVGGGGTSVLEDAEAAARAAGEALALPYIPTAHDALRHR